MEIVHSSRSSGIPLDELLERADYVSLHTPLTPETRHLMGAPQFARMKHTAYLINTARGGVVDQVALREALVDGEIAGAGLDVTDPEPLPADDPLLSAPNLLVVPARRLGHRPAPARAWPTWPSTTCSPRSPAGRCRTRRRDPRRRGRHRLELHAPADRRRRRGARARVDRHPARRGRRRAPAGSATRRSSACSTCCARFRAQIEAHGCERAAAVMTSAVRDAANGAEFAAPRERRARLPGAHPQRRRGGAAHLRRRDLRRASRRVPRDRHRRRLDRARARRRGGASTSRPRSASSATASATCTATRRRRDELDALARDVRETSRRTSRCVRARSSCARSPSPARRPSARRSTSGSSHYDPARIEGHVLTASRLRELLDRLAALPLAQRRRIRGLDPARAPVIVAGIAILLEVVRLLRPRPGRGLRARHPLGPRALNHIAEPDVKVQIVRAMDICSIALAIVEGGESRLSEGRSCLPPPSTDT